MGMSMTGNLVKQGFIVKAFDINQTTLDRCADIVRIINLN